MGSSYKPFLLFAFLWQVAVALLYGFLFGYNDSLIGNMVTTVGVYPYDGMPINSTNHPWPLTVACLAILFLIVGLAMVAGYIEKNTFTGMAFTLLIFAMTIQNFFIFRNFWDKAGTNDPNASNWFWNGNRYNQINLINYGNDIQITKTFSAASFFDAVGCALSLYAGYTAVMGRIGLTQIWILTWIGTFLYECNSQILWRLYMADNGYPMRAFAFGGALGIISSLILGKRDQTVMHPYYRSSYRNMAIAFFGVIFAWCVYPVFALANTYTNTNNNYGKVIIMVGEVQIWLALAGSALGAYTASAFKYRKFHIHDMVFACLSGGIAFMASTDVNFNPGAAIALGFMAGFFCSLVGTRAKRKMNEGGIIDSNSVMFQFLCPSFLACIFSAVLQGIGQTQVTGVQNGFTITYPALKSGERTYTSQGGYQIAAWGISIAMGIGAGIIIGLLYKLFNANGTDVQGPQGLTNQFFDDNNIFGHPFQTFQAPNNAAGAPNVAKEVA